MTAGATSSSPPRRGPAPFDSVAATDQADLRRAIPGADRSSDLYTGRSPHDRREDPARSARRTPSRSTASRFARFLRAEGGGFLISFPDLPGCISDGETISEAVRHGKEAFQSWVSARLHDRLPVPEPSRHEERTLDAYSGRFVQRIPRSLHAELAARAEAEGVSLNSLVLALIANGLGRLRNVRSRSRRRGDRRRADRRLPNRQTRRRAASSRRPGRSEHPRQPGDHSGPACLPSPRGPRPAGATRWSGPPWGERC